MASVLQVAISQIGIKESPANSNKVKYNTWYYGRVVSGAAYPWCAVFIDWCFATAGLAKSIACVQNKAYCPSYVAWAKKAGKWTNKAAVGRLVLFDWDGDGVADHIGIVEKIINPYTIQTIEGNTGNTSQNNGGEVMRRQRNASTILGYIDVNSGKATKPSKVENKQLAIDGSFGTLSVMKLQRWLNTPQDGVISGQSTLDKKYLSALKAVEYSGKEGTGSRAISALQRVLNANGAEVKVDGCIGSKTVKALQAYLNKKQKSYKLQATGYFNQQTAKAFQVFLNTK